MPSKRSLLSSTQIYKITKAPSFLSKVTQQVTVAGFIDDLITVGRSSVKYERNIKLIVTVLDSLGFVAHPNKSIFVPALNTLVL